MKREEKNRRSRERILAAAVEAFGSSSYEETSVNSICQQGQIAKGLIYHYFTNKDGLYLSCVEDCFNALADWLEQELTDAPALEDSLRDYVAARRRFFETHPSYSGIFLQAVLQPPAHLKGEIRKARANFDERSMIRFRRLLEGAPLRDGAPLEVVMEYLAAIQETFHAALGRQLTEEQDPIARIRLHEAQLGRWMDMILYGIVEREGAK